MFTTDDSSNRFRAGEDDNPIHRFWLQQIFIPILHRADAEGSRENPLLHRLLIFQWRRHRSALFINTPVNFHVSGIPETCGGEKGTFFFSLAYGEIAGLDFYFPNLLLANISSAN